MEREQERSGKKIWAAMTAGGLGMRSAAGPRRCSARQQLSEQALSYLPPFSPSLSPFRSVLLSSPSFVLKQLLLESTRQTLNHPCFRLSWKTETPGKMGSWSSPTNCVCSAAEMSLQHPVHSRLSTDSNTPLICLYYPSSLNPCVSEGRGLLCRGRVDHTSFSRSSILCVFMWLGVFFPPEAPP